MELQEANSRLKMRLDLLMNDPRVGAFRNGTFRVWALQTQTDLRDIYGPASDELEVFRKLSLGLPFPIEMVSLGWQQGQWESQFEERKIEIQAFLEWLLQQLEGGGVPEYHDVSAAERGKPKIFIAHGGRHTTLERVLRFIRALGGEPLVVEDLPSLDKSINEKVEYYLDMADCALILATADDSLGEGKQPRGNVLIETGRIQERFPGKTIWLLEEGAKLPSNVSEKVWERFGKDDLERAFIYIAQELGAMGVLSTSKPRNDV